MNIRVQGGSAILQPGRVADFDFGRGRALPPFIDTLPNTPTVPYDRERGIRGSERVSSTCGINTDYFTREVVVGNVRRYEPIFFEQPTCHCHYSHFSRAAVDELRFYHFR
jgi:hypothetical protein